MSAPAATTVPALPKGMAVSVGKLLAGWLLPGMVLGRLAQSFIVLPQAMAPIATALGFHVQ